VQKEKSNLWVWGVLLLLAFVWGSSFILMKTAMFDVHNSKVYSPMEVAALRITIAALVMLPVSLGHLKSITRDKWIWLLAIGTLGNLFPAYLFTTAQTELPSAVVGMLNSLTPLFTMLVAVIIFSTALSRNQIAGLVIGFIGAATLISSGVNLFDVGDEIAWGACFKVALATLLYGISVNILKEKLMGVPATAIAAIALLLVLVPCLIMLSFSNVIDTYNTHDSGVISMAAVVVLSVFGTAGALVLFNSLIKWTNALTASSVTYIIPLFAALWGWLDGEVLTFMHLVGGGVILCGVAIVNFRPNQV
jgi:drug/metabolite transporter (DMT)-like permease